jgi:hypothetical protein
MSWVKLKLPHGTLKLKPARHLRRREREGDVPAWKIGPGYLVWTANTRAGTDKNTHPRTDTKSPPEQPPRSSNRRR